MRIRGLCRLPNGRDWLWGKLGLSLVSRAMLSKSLIQLSADDWNCAPSLLVVCPEATQSWSLSSMVGLMATSKRTYPKKTSQDCFCQCPCPCGRSILIHVSTGDLQTLTEMYDTISCGGHYSFPLGASAQKFIRVSSKSLWHLFYCLIGASSLSLNMEYLLLVVCDILL